MAFQFSRDDEEELAKKPGTSGYLSKPGTGVGQVSGNPTSSGRFVNLQKFLDVNSGKGESMAGGLLGEGQSALDNVNTSGENFQSIGRNLGDDIDFTDVNKAQSNLGNAQYADEVTQETKDFVKNGGHKTYKGPTAGDVDAKVTAFNQAKDEAKKKGEFYADGKDGTDSRANKLKDTFNKDGRYSAGENSFDSFLTENKGQNKFNERKGQFDSAGAGFQDQVNMYTPIYKDTIAKHQDQVDTYNGRFDGLKAMLDSKLAINRPKVESSTATPAPTPAPNNSQAPVQTEVGPLPAPGDVGGPITTGGNTLPAEQIGKVLTDIITNPTKKLKPKW